MRQNAGLAWGMVINEGLIVGSYGNLLLNPNQFILIFPNRFNMNVIHGGLLLGYSAKITRRISCEVESKWGLGEIVINYDETGLAIKDQPITVAQVALGIDYQIFTFLKANASMGYRHFNEFSLAEINQDDFSGVLTQFSIKIGNFKKLRR